MLADSVVNPTRSANSTDTSRRSETTGPAAGVGGATAGAAAMSGVPHSAQNFAPASAGSPHAGHDWLTGAPQWMQNFFPAGV